MKGAAVAAALLLAALAFGGRARAQPRPGPRPQPRPPGPVRPPGPRPGPKPGPTPGSVRVSTIAGDHYLLEFALEHAWLERQVAEHGGEFALPIQEQMELTRTAALSYGFEPDLGEPTPEFPLAIKARCKVPRVFHVPTHSSKPDETALYLQRITRLGGPLQEP